MGANISSLPTFLAAVATFITYIYIRRRNSFLNQLQGPKSRSFWIGEYDFCAPLRRPVWISYSFLFYDYLYYERKRRRHFLSE